MQRVTFIFLFFLSCFRCFTQTTGCEKTYETPDTLAQYRSGKKDLRQYVNEKIIPILGDCIKQKMEFVNSMEIKFTIDKSGRVIAVDFLKPVLSDYCSGKLRAEILTMKGWQPAKLNNEKISSVFIYPIAGIKWQ